MTRKIIVLHDSTTHGGKVITGSGNHSVEGRSIARLGDLVVCPLLYPDNSPHGINKIIEGETSYCIDGIPIALEGHHTECGCTLVGSVNATLGD